MSKKIHFIGILGTGMSGVAKMYLQKGYSVSGSDVGLKPLNHDWAKNEVSNELFKLGAALFDTHSETNLNDVDCIVSNAAIPKDNIEIKFGEKNNIEIIHRAKALWNLVKDKNVISVCGTHGKTSTTTMLTTMLSSKNPTYLIGTKVQNLNTGKWEIGGNWTNSDIAIIESDESDKGFLNYEPNYTILTNIDIDHTDTLENGLDGIKEVFIEFVNKTKKNAVICETDKNIKSIESKIKVPFEKYKVFEITKNLNNNLIGEHNLLNASAAFIIAKNLGLSVSEIKENMKKYRPPYRRMNYIGEFKGIHYIDDHADHPTEVSTTLQAIKNKYPNSKIYSMLQIITDWRARDFRDDWVRSLTNYSDFSIITKVIQGRSPKIDGINAKWILEDYKNLNDKIVAIEELEEAANLLVEKANKGDVIVTLGAYTISEMREYIPKLILNNEK